MILLFSEKNGKLFKGEHFVVNRAIPGQSCEQFHFPYPKNELHTMQRMTKEWFSPSKNNFINYLLIQKYKLHVCTCLSVCRCIRSDTKQLPLPLSGPE